MTIGNGTRTAEQLEDHRGAQGFVLGGSAGGWQRGWLSGYTVGKRAQAAPNWPPAGTRSTPSPSIQPRTRRPKSRDSSIGTSLLWRAQTPCTRRCTVTKPALPSHTAETRAGARSKATCPHVPGIPGGAAQQLRAGSPCSGVTQQHTRPALLSTAGTSPSLSGWHFPKSSYCHNVEVGRTRVLAPQWETPMQLQSARGQKPTQHRQKQGFVHQDEGENGFEGTGAVQPPPDHTEEPLPLSRQEGNPLISTSREGTRLPTHPWI